MFPTIDFLSSALLIDVLVWIILLEIDDFNILEPSPIETYGPIVLALLQKNYHLKMAQKLDYFLMQFLKWVILLKYMNPLKA